MTVAQIGIKGNNAIVPYVAATKRTKQVSLTVTSNVGGNAWTTVAAVGLAYADSTGAWRLVFNIDGAFASTLTAAKILITGVVFSSTGSTSQPVSVLVGGTSPFTGAGQTTQNSAEILGFGVATATAWRFSGDVTLASEPTWAAANMEGAIAVDVYIPPASTTLGLLNYYQDDDTTMASTTFTPNGAGSTGGVVNVKVTRVGRIVTIHIPAVTGATCANNSYYLASDKALPAWARPAASIEFCAQVRNSNALDTTLGYGFVDSNGIISILRTGSATAFSNTAGCGFQQTNVTFLKL